MSTTDLRFEANLKWLFTELPLEQRFAAAAEAGFEGVEVADPYSRTKDEVSSALRDAGLDLVLINTPAGTPGTAAAKGRACLPAERPAFRDDLLRALEYAVALDASFVHVMGGVRPPDTSVERAFATYLENVAWAAEQAAGTTVTLTLEALNRRDTPGFVLESIHDAAAVVQAIGSDRVRLQFDAYHVHASGEDVIDVLDELYPLVAHIQIADDPGRHEPGTGTIPWPPFIDRLRERQYAGWIGLEYEPLTSTTEGLAGMTWLEAATSR